MSGLAREHCTCISCESKVKLPDVPESNMTTTDQKLEKILEHTESTSSKLTALTSGVEELQTSLTSLKSDFNEVRDNVTFVIRGLKGYSIRNTSLGVMCVFPLFSPLFTYTDQPLVNTTFIA